MKTLGSSPCGPLHRVVGYPNSMGASLPKGKQQETKQKLQCLLQPALRSHTLSILLYSFHHVGQPDPMWEISQRHEYQVTWGSWGQTILEATYHSPPSSPQSWARCCNGMRLGGLRGGDACILHMEKYELLWPSSALNRVVSKDGHIYIFIPPHRLFLLSELPPPGGEVYVLFLELREERGEEVTAPISGEVYMVKVILCKFLRLGHIKDKASAVFPLPSSEDNSPWDRDTILWGSPSHSERSCVGVLADSSF